MLHRSITVVVAAATLIVGLTVGAAQSGGGQAQPSKLAAQGAASIASGVVQFDTLGPVRIMDSRSGLGLPYGCLCEHGLMPDIVPGDHVPANATAIFVNLTVVAAEPATFGYVTVEPGAAPGQGTSTVNWDRPGVYSNMALAPIDSGLALGGVKHARLNFQGSGHIEVVVDLLGWVVPTT